MEIEAVSPQALGPVNHHSMVIQREVQADRIAEQNNAPDLPVRKIFFERSAEIVPEVRTDAWCFGQTGAIVSAPGQRLKMRRLVGSPEHPWRAVVGQGCWMVCPAVFGMCRMK